MDFLLQLNLISTLTHQHTGVPCALFQLLIHTQILPHTLAGAQMPVQFKLQCALLQIQYHAHRPRSRGFELEEVPGVLLQSESLLDNAKLKDLNSDLYFNSFGRKWTIKIPLMNATRVANIDYCHTYLILLRDNCSALQRCL